MNNTFETKKDSLRQTQDGIWKLTLTVLPEDMPVELLQAPMGTVYGLAMVPVDYDNPETDVVLTSPTETKQSSEGDKIRVRSIMLCKDGDFQNWAKHNIDLYADWDDFDSMEALARHAILLECTIDSRRELITDVKAQELFKKLDKKFKDWKFERDNEYNLSRY